MSSIDRHRERSIVSKHPGATAKQIKHYIEYFLNEEDLHGVIIVAGLNDLLYSSNNGRNDVIMEDIVAHVIQAGLKAREAGIMNVHLSGLFKVENVRDEHINLFNYLLKQRCIHFITLTSLPATHYTVGKEIVKLCITLRCQKYGRSS